MENKEINEQQEVVADSVPAATKNENLPVNHARGFSSINLFDAKQQAAAEMLITKIMRSEKGGVKSVNDGLAILMRAQDLGLPFSTCIEHIHVINGKTGTDIHIIKALLSRAAITWELTKDYIAQYEYTDGFNVYAENLLPDFCIKATNADEAAKKSEADTEHVYVYPVKWYQDFNGNTYREYQLTEHHQVAVNQKHANNIIAQKKIPITRIPAKPIDFVTEYDLCRIVNGKEVHAIGHFSYSEAQAAGMFTKDTYQKYARILIGHRAFTYAARDIASDILFGVMETSELKIVSGRELNDADIIDISTENVD